MREIDINKIGRKMPYKLPDEDFFEKFSDKLYGEIESQQVDPIRPLNFKKNIGRKIAARVISAAIGVAATVAIVVVSLNHNSSSEERHFAIKKDVVESIDSYLLTLSDEELSQLTNTSEYQHSFYQNLPTYQ